MRLIIFESICLAIASATVKRVSVVSQEFIAASVLPEAHELTGAELVEYVNNRQQFFQAELSPLTSEQHKARLMHPKYLTKSNFNAAIMTDIDFDDDIPENFDARLHWPECGSIRNIRDQSHCGSCWAVSAAETMSDRACIQSNGTIQIELSDTDILSCCGDSCGYGCEGGNPIAAWQYFELNGVCSGGYYGEMDVCKPYVFHPCGHHHNEKFYGNCPKNLFPTPTCKPMCQSGYNKTYESDKIYGKSAYRIPNDETLIQKEIMKNGPVQAAFVVYEDFSHYKSGIYVHTGGKSQGGHAIKLIGWGVEGGIKYWLVANSWNSDWGEERYVVAMHCDGLAKMVVIAEISGST
ncbi:hypothetical protein KIN20_028900 [Parelaphostrongylus tenuis]|uniref:Peptidase C1A papain C-terminal domain-containing protein n=1 Tax=Parelaphostrongylus tenuis TaxID=148309 RepID=A0AAD5WF60_PARTN|nr:hypothetical protein KIN20_028900 [Parelaphostrongylus tenuis]